MKLSVSVRRAAEAAGLLGEEYEFEAFLNSWATWGEHRLATRAYGLDTKTDIRAAELTLPSDPSQVRGDEALWLKQMAHTLPSGVDAIDEANKEAQVKREIWAGTLRLPLDMLLEAAKKGETLSCPTIHTQLHSEFTNELLALQQAGLFDKAWSREETNAGATLCAYKGTLQVTPHLVAGSRQGPRAVDALLQGLRAAQAREGRNGTLMYNSDLMQREHAKALGAAVDSYVADFVGNDKQPPKYALGQEATLEHLHVPYYVSEFGPMPLGAMLQHRLRDRTASTAAERAHYSPTRESAQFANEQLRSACQRLGMDPQEFVAEVKAQMTQSPSDPAHRPGFLKAVDVVGEMGTFAANRVQYTADQGYPNRAALPLVEHIRAATALVADNKLNEAREHAAEIMAAIRHPHVTQLSSRIHTQLKSLKTPYNILARAAQVGSTPWRARSMRLLANTPPMEEKAPKRPALAHECELMDPQPAMGTCFSDDCDAMGGTAADTVRNLPALAQAVSEREAPLLHAAAAIVSKYYVFSGIASVSGGYVDTNGVDLSAEERRKITDLPMIGDDLDKRTKPGGHAIGVLVSKAVVADALARAGDAKGAALVSKGLQSAAWERRSPIYILEGTASSDGYVLPMGEIGEAVLASGGDARKVEQEAAARKGFLKGLLAQATERKDNPPALVKNSNLEGLSFYASKQDPKRRISNFYLGMGLISSPDLAKLDPRLGALALVDVKAQTRGAEMGRFLRMPFEGAQSEVGLVPAYSRLTAAQWDRFLNPVVACIQNQMPLAQSDVLATKEAAETAKLRVGQVIPPSVLLTVKGPLETALDRHVLGLLKVQDAGASLATPAQTNMRLQGQYDDTKRGKHYALICAEKLGLIVLIDPMGRPMQSTYLAVDRWKNIPRVAFDAPMERPYLVHCEYESKYYMITAKLRAISIYPWISGMLPMDFYEKYRAYLPNVRLPLRPVLKSHNNTDELAVTAALDADGPPTTPLCFYLDGYTVGKEDKMRATFAELDAAKAKGEIADYTLTRDQPLLGAAAVYTLTVQLPVVSQ
jgi:hypothetical protein